MKDLGRNKLRVMLGELLNHMERRKRLISCVVSRGGGDRRSWPVYPPSPPGAEC
jgi:hypothetical protein